MQIKDKTSICHTCLHSDLILQIILYSYLANPSQTYHFYNILSIIHQFLSILHNYLYSIVHSAPYVNAQALCLSLLDSQKTYFILLHLTALRQNYNQYLFSGTYEFIFLSTYMLEIRVPLSIFYRNVFIQLIYLQIGIIITQLHLRLNNGMSTTCITHIPLSQNTSPIPSIHLWSQHQNVKHEYSCNDHATVYTDASDHCSTSPQVSDADEEAYSQHKQCHRYGLGYCLQGLECHLVHEWRGKKVGMKKLIEEYPQLTLWTPRRILSFLP